MTLRRTPIWFTQNCFRVGAPERWRDREVLWNEVEAIEARKDAALAREIEVVIPSVLRQDEGVSLVREFMLDHSWREAWLWISTFIEQSGRMGG